MRTIHDPRKFWLDMSWAGIGLSINLRQLHTLPQATNRSWHIRDKDLTGGKETASFQHIFHDTHGRKGKIPSAYPRGKTQKHTEQDLGKDGVLEAFGMGRPATTYPPFAGFLRCYFDFLGTCFTGRSRDLALEGIWVLHFGSLVSAIQVHGTGYIHPWMNI